MEPEDQRMVQGYHPEVDLAQATMQHKLSAYENFEEKGGNMNAFLSEREDGIAFNLVDFLKTLGLNYDIYTYNDKDDEIVITPNTTYLPDDDFEYIINFEDGMVHGHDMHVGRLANGEWIMNEHYDSATDFIFQLVIHKRTVYQIGVDEFDQMYRNLRVLTAPIDKIGEINESIDKELAYTE